MAWLLKHGRESGFLELLIKVGRKLERLRYM